MGRTAGARGPEKTPANMEAAWLASTLVVWSDRANAWILLDPDTVLVEAEAKVVKDFLRAAAGANDDIL